MKFILCLFILLTSAFAKEEPIKVNISILSAVIGPSKVGDQKWDTGFGSLKGLAPLASLVVPFSGMITTSVVSGLIGKAPQGNSAPDVFGTAQFIGNIDMDPSSSLLKPLDLATFKTLTKNSYTPGLKGEYKSWPMYKDTRLRIELKDKDFAEHDLIGKVEITRSDVELAIKTGKPIYINVAEQSQNQLLFIQISASMATGDRYPSSSN
jgi:hypothetical protein